ncbi:MAG TPA: MtrB/PioB family outer membrane beta-barrel protein [Vicinamibacterales bacterium]|nr:MtrB/PioB family outer membrane beta-barrel protein [Vicinamibacterales bacterium]
MGYKRVILAAAFLAVSSPGLAQTPQPQPSQPTRAPTAAPSGTVDIGGRFTTTDGDEARYERYRDDRDGIYSSFTVGRQTDAYWFDAEASHVGYRDQRYAVDFLSRKVNFSFRWDSLPLNFSYIALTPFQTSGSTLTLDDAAQRAVQGPTNAANDGTAVGVPCAPGAPPASCSNPTAAAQAKANRSTYNSLATPFDLRQQRDTAAFGLTYTASKSIDVDVRFTSAMKDGEQPWGASFAFNNAIELPLPLDNRTNDLSVGASWTNPKGMFRIGWDGSWFSNQFESLVWDNPIRITDFNNGLRPPNGPYDPSGYSNGNGPAQGRMSLAPDNSMNVVSATGLYKLPGRSALNGTLQFTTQSQDDALIDWTINPVIDNALVIGSFPHLAQLPRATAQAEAKGVNALLNFSSRPFRRTNVVVRYRFNDRDVQTPVFDATEYVRFDAVPEEIEEGLSHQFDTQRQIFDANASFAATSWASLRVGYGYEGVERHGRGFSDTGENIFRVSFDTFASALVTIRAGFDVSRRRGEGFVETGIDYETGPGGTQPTLRYYDEADRDRTRGSLLFSVMPRDTVDLYFMFSGGKDEYLIDESAPVERPGELFGLQDASVTSWNLGVNFYPADHLAVGANYGRDDYSALQLSRNANPPPDPSWTDPNRNWTLDNDEQVNTFNVYLDLLRAIRDTDIRFGYDYNDSDNALAHGGPRIASLAAANQFIPLPNVENTWHRVRADVQYFFSNRTGVGLGYYFESLDIVDFNTIDTPGPIGFVAETGDPRIDWLGGLITGYGNRSYTGHSIYLRALYRF